MQDLKTIFGHQMLNAFIKIVKESGCKTNKLRADQGKEFYNKLG